MQFWYKLNASHLPPTRYIYISSVLWMWFAIENLLEMNGGNVFLIKLLKCLQCLFQRKICPKNVYAYKLFTQGLGDIVFTMVNQIWWWYRVAMYQLKRSYIFELHLLNDLMKLSRWHLKYILPMPSIMCPSN